MRETRGVFRTSCILFGLLVLLSAMGIQAQVEPVKKDDIAAKAFKHSDLTIEEHYETLESLGSLSSAAAQQARQSLNVLRVNQDSARIDKRTGRFVTLMPTTPLIPGRGVGNGLDWSDLGRAVAPTSDEQIAQEAFAAFHDYLVVNHEFLNLDLSELGDHRAASHALGDIVQIHIPRVIDGIPVRGSSLSAVIGQGNLTLMSMNRWAERTDRTTRPSINALGARDLAERYLVPLNITHEWGKTELVYLPMMKGKERGSVSLARGLENRLAWSVKLEILGDRGRWEVLVDAKTGEILANEDTNHYAEAKGGVQPVTNDGVVPDGVEYGGWPMPFMEVGSQITDTGGNFTAAGSQTARLYGPYVNMADNCGTDSLTQSNGIDWGTSGGTDCTTPGFGGAGNTHASRDGFYELNKLKEMARGQLPSNTWLQGRLTSNMNINSTCNAFWNGSTVNFYRSGGGCANTGEIAAVFDHEWGHGMDDFDVEGTVASPSGEGIADAYTALRLNTSCIGRNFLSTNCTGNGDPCINCTGVRDIDYLKRQSGNPHTYTWSNANCGGSVHCVGGVYSEAIWSLWKRKLQSAPYNLDNNTAHEIVTRMTFIGAGAVSNWFSGGPPNGGCAGSSGYQNFLAAADDNGNLNDGVPFMGAIYAAFNDQEIACNTPTVQDSGCAGTPTAAPTVNATAGNQSVSLSWNNISGASSYDIFRTEGVFACDFGKVKVGSTTGTSFNDTGLQNARDYSYVVIPKGSSAACFGNASACTTIAPASAPDFTVACSPSSTSIAQGGSDTLTCTVGSLGGYTGTINLSCAGNPGGIGCGFAPTSVSPPANGSANSTLTLNVNLSQATGSFNFNVEANDGSTTKTTDVTVQVTPEGQNGPQDAVYNSGLGVPACLTPGTECDTNNLVIGRAGLGPESNQPNTLDGCADGTSGSYQNDESNERIIVRTLDGFDFAEGATVEVEATVYAWSTGSSDTLDLYYAADANSPSWVLIGSQVPSGGGTQVLTAQYTLPTGTLQAVRASFRYQGSQAPCSNGSYDDADDLVFAVNGPSSNTAPSVSITAPTNGSTYTVGDNVSFAGSANDAEDGDLTASLSWSSSIDGAIGSGGGFSTSGLSQGSHTITASVTDSGSLNGSDSISITVNPPANTAPTVTITAPADGSSADEGTSVSFAGTASDTEDGDISAGLSWSSSIDGNIGSGGSFSTSTLSVGSHTITASVTDSGSLSGSDSISLTIDPVSSGGAVQYASVTSDEIIRTVALSGFTNPRVVAGPLSFNGSHASTIRLNNVSSAGFDQQLVEWAYLDGSHTNETMGYLALDDGAQSLGTLAADAGTVNITNAWTTVSFGQTFGAAPVVMTQVATYNDATPVTTRIRNVTATSFQVQLEEEEANDQTHIAERVDWVAIETGTTTFDGNSLTVGITGNTVDEVWEAINFGTSLSGATFLAAMQTTNGGDTCTLRYRNLTASSVEVSVHEEQSANSETGHINEVVGWILIGN